MHLYVTSYQPDPTECTMEGEKIVDTLKSSLTQALGHPNYKFPFFSLCMKIKETLGLLTQRHENQHPPVGYYSQQLDSAV